MLSKKRVWILESEGLPHHAEIALYEKENLQVKQSSKETFQEDFINFGQDAHAIVVGVDFQLPKETIEQLSNCQILCSFGMGFDQIDVAAATAKNIYVTHLPNYCHTEVADHTLALSLALLRRLFDYNKQVDKGIWQPTHISPIQRLSETTIGLLGFGQIARMVAKRFQPFGVHLIAHDQYVGEEVFKTYNVESVSLDELLKRSHLLSLHVPLTRETKHLLNQTNLARMSKNALIVNTSRGGIIDEKALSESIKKGHILGAGLDVLEVEPPKQTNELLQSDQVIITPHAAYYSAQAELQMQEETAKNVLRVFKNKRPFNIVNDVN